MTQVFVTVLRSSGVPQFQNLPYLQQTISELAPNGSIVFSFVKAYKSDVRVSTASITINICSLLKIMSNKLLMATYQLKLVCTDAELMLFSLLLEIFARKRTFLCLFLKQKRRGMPIRAIWLSTYQRSHTLPPHKSVDVAGTRVQTTDTLKTLGVTLDSRLSFEHHVSSICKSCFFHIRAFRHIRPALTQDMAKSVAVSLVGSRLDYANSLLYGTSQGNLHKLQRIQNTLAKLVALPTLIHLMP